MQDYTRSKKPGPNELRSPEKTGSSTGASLSPLESTRLEELRAAAPTNERVAENSQKD